MRIEDKTRDLIRFIGNDWLFKENGKRKIGERHLCGNPFYRAPRSDACEFVSGARRSRLRKQVLQIFKAVGDPVNTMPQEHENSIAGLKAVYQ